MTKKAPNPPHFQQTRRLSLRAQLDQTSESFSTQLPGDPLLMGQSWPSLTEALTTAFCGCSLHPHGTRETENVASGSAFSPTAPQSSGSEVLSATAVRWFPVRGFGVLLGSFPTEMTANFISEISQCCQVKSLSKDKHQSDPGCHGRVTAAPETQAEHITSCRARWAAAPYLPSHITIWKVLAQQPPS